MTMRVKRQGVCVCVCVCTCVWMWMHACAHRCACMCLRASCYFVTARNFQQPTLDNNLLHFRWTISYFVLDGSEQFPRQLTIFNLGILQKAEGAPDRGDYLWQWSCLGRGDRLWWWCLCLWWLERCGGGGGGGLCEEGAVGSFLRHYWRCNLEENTGFLVRVLDFLAKYVLLVFPITDVSLGWKLNLFSS